MPTQDNQFINGMAQLAMELGAQYLSDDSRTVELSHFLGRTAPTPGAMPSEVRKVFYFVPSDLTSSVSVSGDDAMVISDRLIVTAFNNAEESKTDSDVISADTAILIPVADLPETVKTLVATTIGHKVLIEHDWFVVKGKKAKITKVVFEPTGSLVRFLVRNLG